MYVCIYVCMYVCIVQTILITHRNNLDAECLSTSPSGTHKKSTPNY